MRKLVCVLVVLAFVAPASANLLSGTWSEYSSGWGGSGTWTGLDATGGSVSISGGGSYVAWQLVDVPADGDYTLAGDVSGSAGWIEVIFRLNPPWTAGEIAAGKAIDTDDVQFINKHEGSISGSLPVGIDPGWNHTALSNVITASAGDKLLVGMKAGDGGNAGPVNFANMDLTPEPTSALLLGLPILFLRRRR